jgi:hypothetical protein
MSEKQQVLEMLREEFDRWEALLANLSEEQTVTRRQPDNRSIKDDIAHLWAWQQRSIARVEAALQDREPAYPPWAPSLDPEGDAVDPVNEWINTTNQDRPWESVHRDWQEGFLRLIELGEAVPEEDLMDKTKYPWLEGYSLYDVLHGSYEHHHIEHYEALVPWLKEHGILKT